MVKKICLQHGRPRFDLRVRKILWEQLPIPLFLPGESHGQKRLAGYSPYGCRVLTYTKVNEDSILTFGPIIIKIQEEDSGHCEMAIKASTLKWSP